MSLSLRLGLDESEFGKDFRIIDAETSEKK